MKRDLHLEESLQARPRSAPPSRRKSGDGQPTPTSLDALSAAGDKFSDFGSTRSRGIRRPSLALTLLCGLAVGGAAFFLQPARHRIEATLKMSGETDAAGTAQMAQQLREFLHRDHANASKPVEGSEPGPGLATNLGLSRRSGDAVWSAQVAGDGLIRLVQISPETPPNVKRVRVVAERFVAQTTANWEKKRSTPSEPERLVDDLFTSLQHRLHEAKDAAELTGSQVPTDDPSGQRTDLLNRWETQHALFLKQRAQVGDAIAALDRLDHQPQPTSAMVTTERRRQAYEADEALGQDLEELRVKLSQLKARLLAVWSSAAESLNHLVETSTELVATATHTNEPRIDRSTETTGDATDPLSVTVRAHKERLIEFVENWDREFTRLKGLAIDPQNGDILAVHPRVRKLLNNYLYESAKQLAEIRAAIGQLEATSSDQVRHHVRSSQLVRSFHRLRQARDRFEFGAGGLEMPDNFRLDAAMRAARGLRRRTRERTRSIDKRLEARALREAIDKRKTDQVKLAERVERLRREADKTIHDLLMIQITLNDNAASGEKYLRKALEAEVASVRWKTIQEQAVGTSQRLSELIHRRTGGPADPPIELVSCEVVAVNVNLSARLTSSNLAGAAALALVLVGQLWIARKP